MPGLDFLFGREGEFKRAPSTYTPQQQQFFQQALQQGLQGLSGNAIEEQARRGFRQDTIPLLSERFAKMGGIGSSGYQNALQGAGTQLETNLAAQRENRLMNLLNAGLTPYEGDTYYEPGTEGIAGDLAQLAARAGLAYATGGLSEAGFGITDLFKGLFGGKQGQPEAEINPREGARKAKLSGQSPFLSLSQAATGSLSNPQRFPGGGLFAGGGSLFNQPLASQPAAYDIARKGSTPSIISLLNQAYEANLPSIARGVGTLAGLAQPRPGFEL